MATFTTLRAGRAFIRGFVFADVVLARVPRARKRPFVACHPRTAQRRGWRVVMTPFQARWGRS